MKRTRTKTNEWRNGLFIFFIFLLLHASGFAQNISRKITGRVYAATNSRSIPNASVFIKGSKVGVAANAQGEFSLNAKSGDKLLVTSVGYITKQAIVGSGNVMDFALEEDISKENDVVVIGYGKVKRKDVTGAISSISSEEVMRTQPTTVDQALQGKVAGVVVQQVSGQPGGGVSVQIRGLSSFSNNQPLYVIDGVIIGSPAIDGSGTNPLSSINPSEIASIDVLKDASATAIYGSQASNGVIVITTKRGQVGAPRITYDVYAGNQQLPKYYSTMNLRDYATYMNQKSAIIGYDLRPQFANPQYLGDGTNWQKSLFRSAPMQNHSVGISGGDAKTQYLLSGTYFKQAGIALGSDFQRISVRLNLDNKTTNWLKVGASLQLANVTENVSTTNGNVISNALNQTPDVNVKNPDGSFGGNDPNIYGAYALNPFAIATINKDLKNRYQMFGNAYAEINFTKDLSLRNEVSGSFDFGTEDQFYPTYTFGQIVQKTNRSTYNSAQNFYFIIRNYLTYNHQFKKLGLNLLAGHEGQTSSYQNVVASRSGFPSNNVQAINSGDATTATNSGTKTNNAQESYFGRINLSYNGKYLLTGNIRDDGSSKFAPGNRWVITYSGAFAWRLAEEKFMKNFKAVSDLKIRLGYGLTNNQNIADYQYGASLNTVANGLSGIAQLTNNLPNPLAQWETTKSSNIGIDGTMFNKRIEFTFDYYNRTTNGLLLSVPLPLYSGTIPSTGYSPGALQAPVENIASVKNNGFDLSLTTLNIAGKSFTWKTTFILSHNNNKILSLGQGGNPLYGYVGNTIAAKSVVGRSIGEFFGYQTDGIFKTAADFTNHPAIPANSTTGVRLPITAASGGIWLGDVMFRDQNHDTVINEQDQVFLGSPRPKFQLGFNNTFTFKGFDLTVFMSANLGNKVLNQLKISGTNPNQNFGYFKDVLNYAKIGMIDPSGSKTDVNNFYVTNPSTNIIRITQGSGNDNQRISDRYIEDGSFLKCKTIALGYTVPTRLLAKIHINSLRLYASVTNVFTITKYTGYDPEVGSYNPLLAGVDNGFYPQARVFTFGANILLNK